MKFIRMFPIVIKYVEVVFIFANNWLLTNHIDGDEEEKCSF